MWRISSAFVVGEFEVRPLLVVPGLVRGLQADGGGDIFEGAVAHDEPLVLRVWKLYKPAATLVAVELAAGAPQRRNAGCRPGNGSETEGTSKWRDAALIIGATRRELAFGSLVDVAGQHYHINPEAHVADEEQ